MATRLQSPTELRSAGRVVVGTDLSHPAREALGWAAQRAERDQCGLTIVLVLPDLPLPPKGRVFSAMREGNYLANLAERAAQRLDDEAAQVTAGHPSLDLETVVIEGRPAEVLAKATADADLVVVAARGERVPVHVKALGGTADAVVTHAEGPVAVITGLETSQSGPIVVGVDDSPAAAAALEYALNEAERTDNTVRAVHTWSHSVWGLQPVELASISFEDLQHEAEVGIEEWLRDAAARHPGVVIERIVRAGIAAEVLIEESEAASLTVVGSRGRGGFRGLLLGSTSKEVLRHAESPVIVLRG